jgi:hypothetical protein
MKKSIQLSLVLVLLISQYSFAQIKLDLGLKGGINLASLDNVSSSLQTTYGNRTGYHYGVYTQIKILKFAIQPEVIFSRQGQSFSVPNSTQNLSSSFDYINIPVIVKLYLAGGLNLQVGPQFGFLSSATGDLVNTVNGGIPTNPTITTATDISTFVNSSDISLALGAGWDLPFGLNVSARYNLGLSDINEKSGIALPTIGNSVISSLGTTTAKNQVIQISVGYRLFKFGK